MARRVAWSAPASADLLQAIRHLVDGVRSQHAARRLFDEVDAAGASLAELPHRGRIVPEFDRPDRRELPVMDYRLVYRVAGDDEVLILRLMHGRRDFPRPWGADRRR